MVKFPIARRRTISNDIIHVLLVGNDLMSEHAALRFEGWRTRQVGADEMLEYLASPVAERVDLIVMELDEQELSPQQLRASLHGAGHMAPMLYLTADEVVPGITSFGDDYLTRPFSLEQFAASLRSLARRAPDFTGPRPTAVYRLGDLVIDEDARSVTRGGDAIVLSTLEFDLLRFFIRFPQRVQSRRHMIDHVWPVGKHVGTTAIDLTVSYVRRKLEAGRKPMLITVRGSGYILRPAVG